MTSVTLLLTGPSGTGKSTVCMKAATLARQHGLSVAGVVTLPSADVAAADSRQARVVMDARTGRTRPLARRGGPDVSPTVGDWSFSAEALDWGTDLLRGSGDCDLLIVDELGPMELRDGRGWIAALDVLRAGRYRLALVVVRPDLLHTLGGRLAGLRTETLALSEANRDAVPAQIVGRLRGQE